VKHVIETRNTALAPLIGLHRGLMGATWRRGTVSHVERWLPGGKKWAGGWLRELPSPHLRLTSAHLIAATSDYQAPASFLATARPMIHARMKSTAYRVVRALTTGRASSVVASKRSTSRRRSRSSFAICEHYPRNQQPANRLNAG
jgi:hypothetical protein